MHVWAIRRRPSNALLHRRRRRGDVEADRGTSTRPRSAECDRLRRSWMTVRRDAPPSACMLASSGVRSRRSPPRSSSAYTGSNVSGSLEIDLIQRIHISPVRRLRGRERFLLAGERGCRRGRRVRGLRRGAACERQHQQSAERRGRDPSPHAPTLTGGADPPTELSTARPSEAGDLARGCGSPASGRADGTAPRALRVGHEEWSRRRIAVGVCRSGKELPLGNGSSFRVSPGSSLSPARVNAACRPCRRCAVVMPRRGIAGPRRRACAPAAAIRHGGGVALTTGRILVR